MQRVIRGPETPKRPFPAQILDEIGRSANNGGLAVYCLERIVKPGGRAFADGSAWLGGLVCHERDAFSEGLGGGFSPQVSQAMLDGALGAVSAAVSGVPVSRLPLSLPSCLATLHLTNQSLIKTEGSETNGDWRDFLVHESADGMVLRDE